MEENVYTALSLTGINVAPEQLHHVIAWKNKAMSLSNASLVSKGKMFFLIEEIFYNLMQLQSFLGKNFCKGEYVSQESPVGIYISPVKDCW